MKPSDVIKTSWKLVVIYVVGGLLVAFVYAKTAPIVYMKEKEEKRAAIKTMMPQASKIEEIGTWEIHRRHADYYIVKKGEEDVRYVVESYGKGYMSYINLLVSVDKDFVIEKVNILHHIETPGCADEIESDYFLSQFAGKTVDKLIVVKKETQENIQAISGATISSRAVTEDAVKNAVMMLMGKGLENISRHPNKIRMPEYYTSQVKE